MLHVLCCKNVDPDTIVYLMGLGISWDCKDKTGFNLLCMAASNPFAKLSTFEHLMALGCDVNHVTDYGYNVLALYYDNAKRKSPPLISFIVENGFDEKKIDDHTKKFM